MASLKSAQSIHNALISDSRRSFDEIRGASAWFALPWLNLTSSQLTDIFVKWIELASEQALCVLEDDNIIRHFEARDQISIPTSIRALLSATEDNCRNPEDDQTSCWSGTALRDILSLNVKAIQSQTDTLNHILKDEIEQSESADHEIEIQQAKDELVDAILNIGLERNESLSSARSHALSFMNRCESQDSLFSQLVISASYLLSPGYESQSNPYLQRAKLLARNKFPELSDLIFIMRGKAFISCPIQENFEYSLPTTDLNYHELFFQIEAVQLAIQLGDIRQARRWIHHLATLHPISFVFLISDPITRALMNDIAESLNSIRSMGRAVVAENAKDWSKFRQLVQEAQKTVNSTILTNVDLAKFGSYDRASLGHISVLDLEPTAHLIRQHREKLEKQVRQDLIIELGKRQLVLKSLQDEYVKAKNQRDALIAEAEKTRQLIMTSLYEELNISDQEGTRAEKGCLFSLISASAVIVSYIAFAVIFTMHGIKQQWTIAFSKLCLIMGTAPVILATSYQFVYICKRFLLNAQIHQKSETSNQEFLKAKSIASRKYSTKLQEIKELQICAETEVEKATEALRILTLGDNSKSSRAESAA